MLLLVSFPIILLGMTWIFLATINYFSTGYYDQAGYFVNQLDADSVNWTFTQVAPFIIGGVAIWFAIAYFSNTKMIQHATGAQPLMRRENPRVYNIVENLCMAGGMEMPKVNVIDDPQLNAFASGIDKNSYTVTVTTGLLDRLNDEELAGVIGHELTHIRNRDTRLLITSIIFVGIISTVLSLVVRMIYNRMWFGGFSSNNDNDRNGKGGLSTTVILLIGAVCAGTARGDSRRPSSCSSEPSVPASPISSSCSPALPSLASVSSWLTQAVLSSVAIPWHWPRRYGRFQIIPDSATSNVKTSRRCISSIRNSCRRA